VNVIEKPLSCMKNVLAAQNFMQTSCSSLPSIADKAKQQSCQFTAICQVADWRSRLVEVWPWPPFSSSLTELVAALTVWELSDTTLCVVQFPGARKADSFFLSACLSTGIFREGGRTILALAQAWQLGTHL
jgi:hypothetical protein